MWWYRSRPGEIRDHRRVERDVALLELLEQRVPLLAARLHERPLPRHLAEAILLVVVVHVDGPRLDGVVLVHRLEQAVEVRDGAESEPRRLVGVHLRDAGLLRGAPCVPRPSFFASSSSAAMMSGRSAPSLRPSRAVLREPTHPLARLLRRRGPGLGPIRCRAAGTRPVARRGDLVLRAARFLLDRVVEARERNAAHRRDAVSEPELVVVLGFRRLLLACPGGRAGRRGRAARTCPSPSISRVASLRAAASMSIGTPGYPTLAMLVMRLFSMTMSTGPRGGRRCRRSASRRG